MGVINHNAILAVTWDPAQVNRILQFIWLLSKEDQKLFQVVDTKVNGFTNIVMLPDGSNEGWPCSNHYDKIRDDFVRELEAVKYEDGSNSIKWVEVGFGEFGQKVLRGNNENISEDEGYSSGD